jgi:DNA-binding MarR family transcriptional regulator
MSTDSQRVLDSIRRLVQLLRLSDRAAERAVGLSGAQLFVLQELGREPALSLNDLAERTRTDQSSVSVVAARLVERDLVARERSLEDGRRVTISLTRSGQELLREAPPVAQQKLLEALDSLSPSEQRRLSELFGRVVETMGADRGAAPMFFEEESGSRPVLVDSPRSRAARGSRGMRR